VDLVGIVTVWDSTGVVGTDETGIVGVYMIGFVVTDPIGIVTLVVVLIVLV
jgi:hypothetical protein